LHRLSAALPLTRLPHTHVPLQVHTPLNSLQQHFDHQLALQQQQQSGSPDDALGLAALLGEPMQRAQSAPPEHQALPEYSLAPGGASLQLSALHEQQLALSLANEAAAAEAGGGGEPSPTLLGLPAAQRAQLLQARQAQAAQLQAQRAEQERWCAAAQRLLLQPRGAPEGVAPGGMLQSLQSDMEGLEHQHLEHQHQLQQQQHDLAAARQVAELDCRRRSQEWEAHQMEWAAQRRAEDQEWQRRRDLEQQQWEARRWQEQREWDEMRRQQAEEWQRRQAVALQQLVLRQRQEAAEPNRSGIGGGGGGSPDSVFGASCPGRLQRSGPSQPLEPEWRQAGIQGQALEQQCQGQLASPPQRQLASPPAGFRFEQSLTNSSRSQHSSGRKQARGGGLALAPGQQQLLQQRWQAATAEMDLLAAGPPRKRRSLEFTAAQFDLEALQQSMSQPLPVLQQQQQQQQQQDRDLQAAQWQAHQLHM
jgi:hypothetical protein